MSIVAAILIAATMLVNAAFLNSYGTVETTATVSQSILVDDNDYDSPVTDSFAVTGGCTVCRSHWIRNRACIDGTVSLGTGVSGSPGTGGSNGVTVTYMDSVHLENKNPSDWTILDGDNIEADVTFGLVGETFDYTLEATGLTESVEYALIYYADYEDRENNWGGDNPGAILGIFIAGEDGAISDGGSIDIDMDMPHVDDWNNAPPADYTQTPDGYNHKTGAKLWIVPTSDLTDGNKLPLIAWNPTTYLFETELIRYFNNDVNEITIPAGEFIDFVICYEFAIDIIPGTYTITTTVTPVTS